ncbi:OBAP family protein [Dyadobacter sp. CY323]|uniref:OBAP family protein n=1 Tax=Dyadobacter sp. CY323 TaxID=2907302 RepID=UPI001F451D7E|nr:OBAP family protein [Dyadobacter sp. CY323]MCE6992960.1 OBAP family protein [Dyadobacter sp. CY323]
MKKGNAFYLPLLMFISFACGGRNTSSNVEAPGDEKTAKDKLLTAGAEVMQSEVPLKQFSTYLDGFHFYNGNLNAQMEAHHYVSQLNEDVYQAIIFDGNDKDAKIMGIEYIITAPMFETLTQEEKRLWHSHGFEVSSGSLIAPGIPKPAEHELMEKLISTYGKTIHTWHTDQERTLPVGAPMIMMGFTKEGQLHPDLLAARDKRFGISTQKNKENRRDIPVPKPDANANAWEKGQVRQLVVSDKPDSAMYKHR